MNTQTELEAIWRTPPPGTSVITTGNVREGDVFYIRELGAWGMCPRCAWGEDIAACGHLVARGVPDFSQIKLIS